MTPACAEQQLWPGRRQLRDHWVIEFQLRMTWTGYWLECSDRHYAGFSPCQVNVGLRVLTQGLWITLPRSLICVSGLPHSWQPPQWTVPVLLRLTWQQRRGVSKGLEMNDIMEVMTECGLITELESKDQPFLFLSLFSAVFYSFQMKPTKTRALKSMYQSHLRVQFKWLWHFGITLLLIEKNRSL